METFMEKNQAGGFEQIESKFQEKQKQYSIFVNFRAGN